MAGYAVKLTTRYDGMVVATFPDLPGVSALGADDEDARAEAARALAEALAAYARDGIEPPAPSDPTIERAAPALA
jgi:predicted RNase H-like HicB family nuclease